MTVDEAFERFAQLVDLHQAAARRHEQAYIDGLPDTVVAELYKETLEIGNRATQAFSLFLVLADKETERCL